MAENKELVALPTPANGHAVPAVVEHVGPVHPSYTFAEPEPENDTVPLSHYLWIVKRHKWRIMAFVLFAVAATVVVSSRLTPIYESVATIDIDRQAPSGIIGQEAVRMPSNDADQFMATQIKTIQSDSVLRPVAQQFKLSVADSTAKIPGARAANAPITLPKLRVTRPPNTYLLLISYRSPDPELASNVANGVAQSYIEHTYNIRFRATAGLSVFMEKQLEELKAKMERSTAALVQFEKDLSVINPDEKTSILSSRLLQLTTELTNAQTERVRKQAALAAVSSGSLDAAEASSQGEQLRRLADRLDEAREKFVAIKTQYGSAHPEYKKAFSQVTELERQFGLLKTSIAERVKVEYDQAANRETMIRSAVADTKAEFDRLNARSFEYKAVKQEAESDKKFYEELVRKIKEAGINSSFQNSSVRLSDSARPAISPVFPDTRLNALLAFVFSSFLAIGAAVLADVLDTTVRDPEQIQKALRTEVLGSLPIVTNWRNRLPTSAASRVGTIVKSTRQRAQAEAFEEAIRTLRDSILLSDMRRRPRSLLLTSATPREGKSTTALHLAIAHSLQGRKTLLVDADLRRPSIHERLGLANDRGVSTVINGEAEWREVTQQSLSYPDLDVLPAGPASRRAADQLGAFIGKLLHEAEDDYDLVIVDGPPLLGFAEPLQMAAVVDGVVVITLAGQTHRNALSSVLNNLKRLKANVVGIALNEVRQDMSDRYYYYGYHGKYYSKYYKSTKE